VYKALEPLTPKQRRLAEKAAKKKEWTKAKLPSRYTVLNPLNIEIEGSPEFGLFTVMLSPSKQLVDALNSKDKNKNILLKDLPSDISKLIVRGEAGKIPLPKEKVSLVQRMNQPYETWASPLATKALAAVHFKNKMRQMDNKVVDGVINRIVKVTIGNDVYPATTAQLQQLADIFQHPGKNLTLFWNHTLNIEIIEPDLSALGLEKFEPVNKDIRDAFGISEVLLGSTDKSFASSAISIRAFIQNLEQGRQDVKEWVEGEYATIAEVMGFDTYPTIEFDSLSLADEPRMIRIFLQMIDHGVISYKAVMEKLGFDYDQQVSEMRDELKLIDEGVLGRKQSPYQGSAGGQGGRPSEVPGDYPTRDTTDPKGEDSPDTKVEVKEQEGDGTDEPEKPKPKTQKKKAAKKKSRLKRSGSGGKSSKS
jgi:hypothetical protein